MGTVKCHRCIVNTTGKLVASKGEPSVKCWHTEINISGDKFPTKWWHINTTMHKIKSHHHQVSQLETQYKPTEAYCLHLGEKKKKIKDKKKKKSYKQLLNDIKDHSWSLGALFFLTSIFISGAERTATFTSTRAKKSGMCPGKKHALLCWWSINPSWEARTAKLKLG